MFETSIYEALLRNVIQAIRRQDHSLPQNQIISAFDASEVMAMAFCKSKEEVWRDTVQLGYKELRVEPEARDDDSDDDPLGGNDWYLD